VSSKGEILVTIHGGSPPESCQTWRDRRHISSIFGLSPQRKWYNSFSHATNDCNDFHQRIQSAINEGRLAFQEMQVDTQPFPVNTIEPTCKRVLVRPEVANKGKDKITIIDDLRTSNISQEGIARKAPDRKTTSSEASGVGSTKLPSKTP
jgi:hypothetical protein